MRPAAARSHAPQSHARSTITCQQPIHMQPNALPDHVQPGPLCSPVRCSPTQCGPIHCGPITCSPRSNAARSHATRSHAGRSHAKHMQPDPLLPQRNSACDVRQRACGLAIYCLTREGKGVAVAQASGRGRELTRKLPSLGRVGHLGCARSWLLWHTLSLQRISMAPCLRVGAPAVERVCGSG